MWRAGAHPSRFAHLCRPLRLRQAARASSSESASITALLETVRCPLSKESLVLTDGELVSPLGLAFRVSEDGIPNLIPADARMIADPQIEP